MCLIQAPHVGGVGAPYAWTGEKKGERMMKRNRAGFFVFVSAATLAGLGALTVHAQSKKVVSSYGPTNQDVTFDQIKAARLAVKAERAKAHADLLASRYDLKAGPGHVGLFG